MWDLCNTAARGLPWRLLHNTGNFIDSELDGASTRAKKVIKSVPYGPIPYASEQGIFGGLAGN